MNAEMDDKTVKQLAKAGEMLAEKLESRLAEKWPEYRETEDATLRKKIVVQHHNRMAMRWAKVWLPRDGDREVRAVELIFADYLEQADSADPGAESPERQHQAILQGLVNLGNSLATVLKAAQAGNRDARLAAIEKIAQGVRSGTRPVDILEESRKMQPIARSEVVDPNDVMD